MYYINQIKEILEEKGVSSLNPSKEVLKRMGIHIHSWNKWVNKKSDPEFSQVPEIARFLDCDVSDIFPKVEEEDYAKKHNLLS